MAPPPPAAGAHALGRGRSRSRALRCARLGVFAHSQRFKGGDLARAAGANEDTLYRVLRALSGFGLFVEHAPRQVSNNAASALLRSGAPGMFDLVVWLSDPFHLRVYADAMHSVMTGQPAIEKTVGVPAFDYFPKERTEDEFRSLFDRAGLRLTRVIPTGSPLAVIEAR